jgi:hypothetical protein
MKASFAWWYASCNGSDQAQPGTWRRAHNLYMLVVLIERSATEELDMNAAKSKSAWVALLAAGGLYAWRNRDKIQSWVNTQRGQFDSQARSSLPATGETRRIDQQDVPSSSSARGIYNES